MQTTGAVEIYADGFYGRGLECKCQQVQTQSEMWVLCGKRSVYSRLYFLEPLVMIFTIDEDVSIFLSYKSHSTNFASNGWQRFWTFRSWSGDKETHTILLGIEEEYWLLFIFLNVLPYGRWAINDWQKLKII